MEQGRLSDLGLTSIESQLRTEVMKTKSFQDSIITKLLQREGERNLLLNDFLASSVILKLRRF